MRWGMRQTPVANRRVVVVAAIKESAVNGSRKLTAGEEKGIPERNDLRVPNRVAVDNHE